MAGELTTSGGAAGLIDTVADWLMTQALAETDIERVAEGCFNRLRAAGIPLWRANIAFNTLHPLVAAVSLSWYRDQGMGTDEYRHGSSTESDGWLLSPHAHMADTGVPFLRRRLAGEEAVLDFPILTEFRDKGATDYLAYTVSFGGGALWETHIEGMVGSWATDRPSGFSNQDIQSLLRIQQRLAVACKVTIRRQITRNILDAYLGRDAGRLVLDGRIQRGSHEAIHAVILFSDMRGSSTLADTVAPEEFFASLNTYFECTAGAVLDHDGEVLRFIGDAVLAIFPIRDGGMSIRQACEAALAAAQDAGNRLDQVNGARRDEGLDPLGFGIGLHVGDVMYGNIGVPDRLEFSVIGPAANEVARLENLTKTLKRRILVSGEFSRNLSVSWENLGSHQLRGINGALQVFSPRDGEGLAPESAQHKTAPEGAAVEDASQGASAIDGLISPGGP
jgi:adenylate cyclase